MTHHNLASVQIATHSFARLMRNQRGAAAVEYGLMAALLAVAAIQALASLGLTTSLNFDSAAEAMAGESGVTTPIIAPSSS